MPKWKEKRQKIFAFADVGVAVVPLQGVITCN